MLTFTEACTVLRLSPKTVRKIIASGELEASRVGTHGRGGKGQYRIEESAVTDYLDSHKVVPAKAVVF